MEIEAGSWRGEDPGWTPKIPNNRTNIAFSDMG
jgi:hypothetical protein